MNIIYFVSSLFGAAKSPSELSQLKHYSVALTKKTSDVKKLGDLRDKKSCHYDVTTHATFKNPMCSLIYKKVIPEEGSVYESVAEYFKKSCVPGAQTRGYWNKKGTVPDSLCSLCRGWYTYKIRMFFAQYLNLLRVTCVYLPRPSINMHSSFVLFLIKLLSQKA